MISILELQKTLILSSKDKAVREQQLIKAIEMLVTNMDHLSETVKKNAEVIDHYSRDQKPILAGISGLLKDKKESIKEKLNPLNMLRSVFGIKEGSRSLADIVISGLERKKEIKTEKKEFAKDYMQYNKKGISEKNLFGEKKTEKIANDLFDSIKKKQVELAAANIAVEKGRTSIFGRPLKKDVEQQDKIKSELDTLTDSGFRDKQDKPDIKVTDSNKILTPSTPAQSLDNLTEDSVEANKRMDEQTNVLKQIEINTKGGSAGKTAPAEAEGLGGGLGGLLSGMIPGFIKNFGSFIGEGILMIGEGLLKGLKFLFNPATLGKLISKVFVPAAIIATLFSGLMDGFDEYSKSGDIGKAVIAGLGGMLKFITFGLFDKDTVQNVVDKVGPLVNDYVIQPIKDLLNWVSDLFQDYIGKPLKNAFKKVVGFFLDIDIAILKFLRGITIPAIKLNIPGTDIGTTVGPWHPFDNAVTKGAQEGYESIKKSMDAPDDTKPVAVDPKAVKVPGTDVKVIVSTNDIKPNAAVDSITPVTSDDIKPAMATVNPSDIMPASAPNQADVVKEKTNEVKDSDKQSMTQAVSGPTVVSAPTTINKSNTNQFSTKSVRNNDSTIVRYNTSRTFMFG